MTGPLDVALWSPWLRDGYGSPSSGASPSTVTFPTTALVSRIQIALGADLSADPSTWNWLDITRWVRVDLGVSLRVGRRDESATVTTGSARMKLDNRDGRFTRRNPLGPYYGLLSKNTPIWATVDAGSGEKTRLEMYVNEWPKTWTDKSATDSTVTIQCAGILRRLAQGTVLKSALRQYVANETSPIAWWPMEDNTGATEAASGLVGGTPLRRHSGTAYDFGAITSLPGAVKTPDMAGSGVMAAPVTGGSATGWCVEAAVLVTGDDAIPLYWATPDASASHPAWVLIATTSLTFRALGMVTSVSVAVENGWHHVACVATQDGADIDLALYVDGVLVDSDTDTGVTLGAITRLMVGYTPIGLVADNPDGLSVAHAAIYNSTTPTGAWEAALGFPGEMAHVRIARVCALEGIPFTSTATSSAAMGPQPVAEALTIMRECEAADGGVLYEKRWGLAYQSLAERYNAPVGLALDIAEGHLADIPEPADDDQRTRNRVTVSRTNGSEATAEQTTGPMGTGAEGPGLYDDSVTLNVDEESQLLDQAGWRVHLGTVDEDRWPDLGLNLVGKPELIDAWCSLGYGARVTVANPLPQMPPDPPDLIIEGHAERWDSKTWRASLNCSPASPYVVFVIAEETADAGEYVGRLAGEPECALLSAIDEDDTTITLDPSPVLWTTDPDDYDPDLELSLSGEVVAATGTVDFGSDTYARSVTPTATDAYGRTVSNGWSTADTGQTWTSGGGVAGDYNVAAGVGTISMSVVNSTRRMTLGVSLFEQDTTCTISVPVTASGAQISTGLLLAYVDSSNYYQADLLWQTAGTLGVRVVSRVAGVGTTLDSAVAGAYSPGDTWHIRASIASGRIVAKAWEDGSSEPDNWQVDGVATTLTAAGPVGFRYNLEAGNTNVLPVVISADNLTINPVAQSWSTSSSGHSWTAVGGVAGDYAVLDGRGLHGLSTVNASRRSILGLDLVDSDITVTVECPAVALTADIHVAIMSRYQDGSNYYMVEPQFEPAGQFTVTLYKQVAGVFTLLDVLDPFPPKPTYAAGDIITMRMQTFGTTVRGKVWLASGSEPDVWHVSATVTDFDSGDIGLRSNLSLGNTNTLPVVISYSDFVMNSPTSFTVIRAINGIEKAHAAGTLVEVKDAHALAL